MTVSTDRSEQLFLARVLPVLALDSIAVAATSFGGDSVAWRVFAIAVLLLALWQTAWAYLRWHGAQRE